MTNTRSNSMMSWARLVRLPNAFTVVADVSAAFLLTSGVKGWLPSAMDARMWVSWLIAVGSGVALYWGGMVLNDVFDIRADRRARSERPLPRREIKLAVARRAGWALLLIGVALASLIGANVGDPTPGVMATALAVCVVLYDGVLKRTPLAPLVMGLCRVFSFLLGATSAMVAVEAVVSTVMTPIWPLVIPLAIGMGIYITGVTTFARREAIGDSTFHLPTGWAVMLLGGILLAGAPHIAAWVAPEQTRSMFWQIDPWRIYPAAIALMLAPALRNGFVAWRSPSPKRIQQTIRSAILAIIPLMAVITMLGAGAVASLCVFALLIPSTWLARRFRVT